MPLSALLCAVVWVVAFFKIRRRAKTLAVLRPAEGETLFITSAETLVGRSRSCDIKLEEKGAPKRYAIINEQSGFFSVIPLFDSVTVNGEQCTEETPIENGDKITLDNEEYTFTTVVEGVDVYSSDDLTDEKISIVPGVFMLLFLSVFQILICAQTSLRFFDGLSKIYPVSFAVIIVGEWLYLIIERLRKKSILPEVPMLFLISIGLTICYSYTPDEYPKQLICAALGFTGFVVLRLVLYSLPLVLKLRYIVGCMALILLAANLVFGTKVYGSKNWIDLGVFSFQPSEIVKVAYIFAGASALSKRELSGGGLWLFLGFSGACMGALAIMVDFGAVAIFFVTMIIIMLMRLTDIRIVAGISLLAALGAGALVVVFPHIANRFAAWGHVWQYADTSGYQQTRTLIYSASGGLFGVGAGNGYLKDIAAADTDLVFGMVNEEFGAIVSFIVAMCFVALVFYAVKMTKNPRSTYFAVAACAASGMMLFQTALNIFGSTDILPLTGVTIPFVSNGGTSMIAGFCLIALIKSVEATPKNPSGESLREISPVQ